MYIKIISNGIIASSGYYRKRNLMRMRRRSFDRSTNSADQLVVVAKGVKTNISDLIVLT